MWFQCCYCEMILPLYEIDPISAKYTPMDDWICLDCADDLMREHCEEPEDFFYPDGECVTDADYEEE